MVIVVVVINLALALMLLYGAWRVRKLRQPLGRIADIISRFERSIHRVLQAAPNAILKGQLGIQLLGQKRSQLEPQLQRVRLVLTLLGLGQQVWRRFVLAQRSR